MEKSEVRNHDASIAFGAYLTCYLALAGWVDFSRWRHAATAHAAGPAIPVDRAADPARPPGADPDLSIAKHSPPQAGGSPR